MDLVIGREYRRTALHEALGGQRQGGISTPAERDVILLFTGESGEQYGYKDGPQPDGLYWYTGEGQLGDMRMIAGNKAIRDAEADGKRLLLFRFTRKAHVRYEGEVACIGFHEGTGPDKDGATRKVIIFHLDIGLDDDTSAGAERAPDVHIPDPKRERQLASLGELRKRALAKAPRGAPAKQRAQNVYARSKAVKDYVLMRSKGICESCQSPAPFVRKDKSPYLEPHHIRRIADGGPDHPRWVGAICPTCHRRIHHARDGQEWNQQLADYLAAIEEE